MRLTIEAVVVIALFQSVCQSGTGNTVLRKEGFALRSGQEDRSTLRRIDVPRIKLFPVDEASQDSSLLGFRTRLLTAVKKHDENFLLRNIDPEIINGEDIQKGVDEFKRRWQLDRPDSPLWDLLASIISNGGSFNTDKGGKEFCAPYAVSEWSRVIEQLPSGADPYGYVAITAKDVAIRSEPNLSAPVIETLSYDVVRVRANASVKGGSPPNVFTWLKIIAPSGQDGYISDKYTSAPTDYRACFRKIGGEWVMSEFASRE